MEDWTEGPAVKARNPVLTLGGRVSQGVTMSTLIVSLVPCLLMCALGVCTSRTERK